MAVVWPSNLWEQSEDDAVAGAVRPLVERLESSFRAYQQAATAPEPEPAPLRLPSPSEIFGGAVEQARDAVSAATDVAGRMLPSPVSLFGEPTVPTSQQQAGMAPAAASGEPQAMPTGGGASAAQEPVNDVRPPAMPAAQGGGNYGEIDNSSRQAFVRTAYPYMLEAAGGDKNLAELMLAKAISENGDVGSGGGFIGNNFSGIKGEGDAGSFEADTWEDYGNGRVNIRDRFAAYSTPQVGFRAFMQFLHDNSRYAPALARYQQTGDASQLFRDIRAAGYATDPLWADKVENIRANQVAPIVRGQADQDMQRLSLNAAPAAAPGRTAPPAPAGVSSAPAGAPPAPWETAGASDGGPMLLKENDETAPMGGGDAMLPGDGGFAPTPEYDPRAVDEGPRESRPLPIMPTDPTVTDPAYNQSPTGMTYGPVDTSGPEQGPASMAVEMQAGGEPTPGGDWTEMPVRPMQARQPEPEQPGIVQRITDALTPIYNAGGTVVGYMQGGSDGAAARAQQTRAPQAIQTAYSSVLDQNPEPRLGPEDPNRRTGVASIVDDLGNAGRAAWDAATEAPTIANALPTLRGLDIVTRAIDEFGTSVGRSVAASLGWSDEDFTSVAGIGISPMDVAGVAGSVLLDPTNLIPGTGTGRQGVRNAANAAREAAPGIARRAGEMAQGVGRRVSEAADARVPGETLLGSGVVPEVGSRRFYHGTAGAFERPDPGRFDENGLFGPGYYLTSDPRVAGSYAEARGTASELFQLRQRAGEARRIASGNAPGTPESSRRRAAYDLREIEQQIVRLEQQPGPNVRAVDVPAGLRLLDADAPVSADDIAMIRYWVERSSVNEFWGNAGDPGEIIHRQLVKTLGSPKAANDVLAQAGFDGITHTGGRRVPMMDDAGKPIDHDVTIIFPESLTKIRNAFSGEYGGSGFVPTMSDLRNAAQGGVLGAMSEQVSGEELTPEERLARIGAGAALATVAGRRMRPGAGRRLGAGMVPEPGGRPSRPTVEVAREMLADARARMQEARWASQQATSREARNAADERFYGARHDETLALRALDEAVKERQAIEPAIRSDYGRPVEKPTKEGLEDANLWQDRVNAYGAAGLTPPSAVATDMRGRQNSVIPGFDPTSAAMGGAAGAASEGEDGEQGDPLRTAAGLLIAGIGGGMSPGARRMLASAKRRADALHAAGRTDEAAAVLDAALRRTGQYDPRLAKEPVLPGMEPPRRAPGDAGPPVSEARTRDPMLGDVPPSAIREPMLPGMEPPPAGPLSEAARAVAVTPEQRVARANAALEQFPQARNWYERARMRNEARMQREGVEAQSPLRWLMDLVGTVSYSSMLGPGTMSVNLFTGALEPLWAAPKEVLRGGVRAVQQRNLSALREPLEMAGGAVHGMTRLGEALIDLAKSRGAYAPNPDFPMLSQRTADPTARLLVQALEAPGKVWSALPDAIFGTIAQHAGQAREAAQIATNRGLKGAEWKAEVTRLLDDARAVGRGELSTSTDVQKVVDAGDAYAKRQSYRDELGTIGRKAEKVAKLGGLPILGTWASPFFRTPWNAALAQAEKSPIGFAMNRQASRFDKNYDAILGTAAILGLAEYARQGGVTGSGPTDPKERELLQQKGWQPYSVLVGNTYVPTRMFAIFEGPLNAAGELHDAIAYRKQDADQRADVTESAQRLGKLIRQNPYALSGIVSLLELPSQGVAGFASEQITRVTPLAATARTIGMAGDPMERTTDRGKDVPLADEIVQRWQQGVGMRQGLPVAQDAFGQPKANERPGGWALVPRMRNRQESPEADIFLQAGVKIGDPKSEVALGRSATTPKLPLTPSERREWDRLRGEVLRDAAREIAVDPEWATAPKDAREKVLRGVMESAAKMADDQMKGRVGDDEINRRVEREAAKKAS